MSQTKCRIESQPTLGTTSKKKRVKNKIRDLFKVKLYTIRSKTKIKEREREREKKKREREREKKERETLNVY